MGEVDLGVAGEMKASRTFAGVRARLGGCVPRLHLPSQAGGYVAAVKLMCYAGVTRPQGGPPDRAPSRQDESDLVPT